MYSRKSNVKASWLHISDLHVFPEADTTLMLDDYGKLAKVISPQFLIVTGDFRNMAYATDFSFAESYLESLLRTFQLAKKDIFLIPGNHDVNQYDGRFDAINDISLHSETNYNIYSKYLLNRGFFNYDAFVRAFYNGTNVADARVKDPSGVHCIVWNNLINILCLNTALISDGNKDHKQIVDINSLSSCEIDPQYPTIMLGHHGLDSLYESHFERVINIIDRRKISAYLHGDSHRYSNHPIMQISVPNRTIPSITCAKSAPQSDDTYSDIGVVYYEWRDDDKTYVQAYRWTKRCFVEDSAYFYDINKRYFFPMIYTNRAERLYEEVKLLVDDSHLFLMGNWVDEAEGIWQVCHHEGIGRCLLLFYCEKAFRGDARAHMRAEEIYQVLVSIPYCDTSTQKMLTAIKEKYL